MFYLALTAFFGAVVLLGVTTTIPSMRSPLCSSPTACLAPTKGGLLRNDYVPFLFLPEPYSGQSGQHKLGSATDRFRLNRRGAGAGTHWLEPFVPHIVGEDEPPPGLVNRNPRSEPVHRFVLAPPPYGSCRGRGRDLRFGGRRTSHIK